MKSSTFRRSVRIAAITAIFVVLVWTSALGPKRWQDRCTVWSPIHQAQR